MLEALYHGVRGQIGPTSPKAVGLLCKVWQKPGMQEMGKGLEWGVEPLFLIWVLPLNKSSLISVPQTPIYKMGESDYLISESAFCPIFLEQKEERQWGRSSGKRTAFTISPSGRGNLATTEVTQFS